jgi:hypothetical protein
LRPNVLASYQYVLSGYLAHKQSPRVLVARAEMQKQKLDVNMMRMKLEGIRCNESSFINLFLNTKLVVKRDAPVTFLGETSHYIAIKEYAGKYKKFFDNLVKIFQEIADNKFTSAEKKKLHDLGISNNASVLCDLLAFWTGSDVLDPEKTYYIQYEERESNKGVKIAAQTCLYTLIFYDCANYSQEDLKLLLLSNISDMSFNMR